ncbi:multiple sugar transport system permease protein [Deinococcus metalli]|uniref:ABC transporter permease n=1 Tax=Deinococcus metalli TaxID=1141878 RepID=A0A7W8KGQ4_9DEIO|nr:carbohydrate ABC transporter permease [Deinococcus metalli]MBB5376808.1 multiple sugar transport system permease protein [Deinococcus metalli]GHF45497.1 ABC transporter permease [Deinococcus metalli]
MSLTTRTSDTTAGTALRDADRAARERARRGRGVRSALHAVGLVVILVATLFPFLWMVSTSLKTTSQITAKPPLLVFQGTLEHYRNILGEQYNVGGSLVNSLIVATSATLLAVLLGTPAAYALARFSFKRKDDLWFWFISNRFMSPVVIVLPVYLMASKLRLIGNPALLVAMYLTFSIPIVVWICTDQFRSIPRELDEAAMVDGATPLTIFARVALPLALPGVVVSSILSFIFNWNELLFALFLTRGDGVTAPVRATNFLSGYDVPWGEIMATGTLIVLPVVVFSLLVSRHLVKGLTMGAIK